MKLESHEIAPSGKRRLVLRIGLNEAIVMKKLAEKALQYTPETFSNIPTINALHNIARGMKDGLELVNPEDFPQHENI